MKQLSKPIAGARGRCDSFPSVSNKSKPDRMADYLEAVCAPILPESERDQLQVVWTLEHGVYGFVIIAPASSGGRLVGTRGWTAEGIRRVAAAYAGGQLGWKRDDFNVNVKRTHKGT